MEKALLIGNGINRIKENEVDWEALLTKLSQSFQVEVNLTNEYKPFPLLFQELLYRKSGGIYENRKLIKQKIAEILKDTPSNSFHHKIINADIQNILTTNYDYAFEKVLIDDISKKNEIIPLSTLELEYSLKRRSYFEKENKSIWHLHGELDDGKNYKPNFHVGTAFHPATSIMIGYDHYSDYLFQIQDFVNGGKSKMNHNLYVRLRENIELGTSWIDFFFTHELFIAGFRFDFSESHLWWLLDYRTQFFRNNPYLAKNKIYYCIPRFPDVMPDDVEQFIKQQNKRKHENAKTQIMESLDMQLIRIKCSSYEDFYNKLINNYIKR